jgi:hypothetical protein
MVKSITKIVLVSLIGCMFILSVSGESNSFEINHVLTIESPEWEPWGRFGRKMVITGDKIIIGELRKTVDRTQAGKVHIFDLEGNLETSIEPPTPNNDGFFGSALLVKDNQILIGEHGAKVDNNLFAGLIHIYDYEGTHLRSIQSPDPEYDTHFGASLASIDDIIVTCEDANVDGLIKAGVVHFFNIDGEHQMTIQSPEPQYRVLFGYPLTVGNGKLVITETSATVDDIEGAGKVHLFDTGGNYISSMTAPEPHEEGSFGGGLAINDKIIAVNEFSDSEEELGRVHLYDLEGIYLRTIQSPGEEIGFGGSFALGQSFIIVANTDDEDNGRAYVYDLDGVLLETISGEDVNADSAFGDYIAISEDMIAISEQGDEEEGRVYLFGYEAYIETETPVEDETSSQPSGGIPGFPVLSILAALVIYYLLREWMK